MTNAMNVRMEERTQSAEEFMEEIKATDVVRRVPTVYSTDTGRVPRWMKILIVASVGLIAAVGVVISTGALDIAARIISPPQVEDGQIFVPSVLNYNEDSAKQMLEDVALVFQIIGKENSDKVAEGTVYEQTPTGGSRSLPGNVVAVTISAGPTIVYMPNVCGIYEEDAVKKLEDLGLRVRTTRVQDAMAPGAVVSQDIEEDTALPRNSIVNLEISDGRPDWGGGASARLPSVVGKSLYEAKKILEANKVYLLVAEERLDDYAPKDEIIFQRPGSGATVKPGDIVRVTVSMGINMARIFDMQYMDYLEAVAQLEEDGLVASITYEQSETIAENIVISQGIESGTEVVPGTVIELVVSLGTDGVAPEPEEEPEPPSEPVTPPPTPVTPPTNPNPTPPAPTPGYDSNQQATVPYVVGEENSRAINMIIEFGLVARVEHQPSNTVEFGYVISQSPVSGVQMSAGGVVNIYVSTGPLQGDPNFIPGTLVGKTLTAATRDISRAGYGYSVIYEATSSKSEDGEVLDAYLDMDESGAYMIVLYVYTYVEYSEDDYYHDEYYEYDDYDYYE